MSILKLFLKEYNELHHEIYAEETTSDILSQIRQVEKIMSNPKFHPTMELKAFYKNIRDQYKKALKILLIGNQSIDKISFINAILKDSIIPLHNGLIQKKIIVRYSPNPFVRIHYKDSAPKELAGNANKDSILSNTLHSLDMSSSHLDQISSFEIFVPSTFLQSFEIIKDIDGFKQENALSLKEADIYIWLLELKSKMIQQDIIAKILKKKPTLAILTKTQKYSDSRELLEQISLDKNMLNKKFKLSSIHDISFEYFFSEQKIDEKFIILKCLGMLEKQLNSLKNRTYENINILFESNKNTIEQFYLSKTENNQKDSKSLETKTQHQRVKMQTIEESILKMAQTAKTKKDYGLLKEVFEKNKTIDMHYKILFDHYKSLDNSYHKEHLNLMAKAVRLNNEYNREILGNILRSFKRYLESIVDSILDNIELVKIRIRPKQTSFVDILTNRHIIYETFQINTQGIIRELEDNQSLLARKHKTLLSKINRFDAYINNTVEDNLLAFGNAIEEWVKRGHHLVLQKKPLFISMDGYFSLEEFNLGVYRSFTKKHYEIMRDFAEKIHTELTMFNVWVRATKKMLLECVVEKLKDKFHQDKMLAKNAQVHLITPLNRALIVDTILEILPEEIKELFCLLPYSKTQFNHIPALLHEEAKENEKIIRYRIREIIDLRQTMKVGTKLLEKTMTNVKLKE
ncbi:hypothetical protein [Helicobacter aurati]|uniref:hypothetical protein n=1 Tax=Helicobacter aurati TaxID=137778 RepID=UPI0011C069F7|nr:hypothetical protein [Helicobacter aurati]